MTIDRRLGVAARAEILDGVDTKYLEGPSQTAPRRAPRSPALPLARSLGRSGRAQTRRSALLARSAATAARARGRTGLATAASRHGTHRPVRLRRLRADRDDPATRIRLLEDGEGSSSRRRRQNVRRGPSWPRGAAGHGRWDGATATRAPGGTRIESRTPVRVRRKPRRCARPAGRGDRSDGLRARWSSCTARPRRDERLLRRSDGAHTLEARSRNGAARTAG